MAQLKDLIVNGVSRFLGKITAGIVQATSFIKSGGTSRQFLKADGSVDSTSYQSTLVSGTNIKTINNESLLGSGNITIQGGGGSVTGITAGAGLNTTSSDTATDGGTISASGTLYLTKSGVTAGTYQGITVDKYGRVTAASNQGYGTYSKPSNGIPASDLASGVIPTVHNVPAGGSSGQVLSKASGTDYDLSWITPSGPTATTYNLNNTYLRIAAPTSAAGNSIIQIITNQNEMPILHVLNFGFAYNEEPWAAGWLFGNSGQSAISDLYGGNEILLAQNSNTYAMAMYFPISDTSATAEVTVLYGATPSISVVSGLASGEQWLEYTSRWITLGTSSTGVDIDDTNNRLRFYSNSFYTNLYYSTIVNGGGGELTSRKVTSLSSSSTTTQYPSAKTTYDEIHPATASSMPSGGFLPNKEYKLGTITGTKTFTLAAASDSNVSNFYFWTFTAGSTAPTITWPSNITWQGGAAPTVSAGKYYEILIQDSHGTYLEF